MDAHPFLHHMRALLGAEFDPFRDALSDAKPRHLRLNRRRPWDFDAELRETGLDIVRDDVFDTVRRVIEGGERAAESITFQTGGCYIQNPSSLYPPTILARFMPDTPVVLDMAAAPGGKTTALTELFDNRGLVIANEPSKKRLKALNFNLERNGAFSAKTVSLDGRVMPNVFTDTFHGILLDAPCSNENKFFRNPEVARQWSVELVERMAELQKQLITQAYACLAPGGVLVYSTCTFSVAENEDVISHLVSSRPDAELVHLDEPGTSNGVGPDDAINEKVIRVWPHTSNFDGFFIAAVKKPGEPYTPDIHPRALKGMDAIFADYPGLPEATYRLAGGRVFMESPVELSTRARFDRTGLGIARQAGHDFIQSAPLSWEFGHLLRDEKRIEVDREAAVRYLKGFDLTGNHATLNPVIVHGDIPLGPVKPVGSSLKNKLDRYFLYGKTITW